MLKNHPTPEDRLANEARNFLDAPVVKQALGEMRENLVSTLEYVNTQDKEKIFDLVIGLQTLAAFKDNLEGRIMSVLAEDQKFEEDI